MKKIRITAIRKVQYSDLSTMYENPIERTCDIEQGTTFISVDGKKPEELCESAWGSIRVTMVFLLLVFILKRLNNDIH